MSTYVSLYRKYRPQRFGDLVGQGHITRILQNALESGRVAHAYLFCGPRGTGKTTTARLLAKAMNCANGPTRDPCNACNACERITMGSALDVIEIDAASNRGIDDMRDLREKVKYAPAEARHKVYVIDECHMLTTEAFNALLKTLEEPPAHVLFILATTDPQKVPATILSRCQRLDFRRGNVSDLVERLRVVANGEELKIEDEALTLVARSADGSWRDALSILEQIVAYGQRQVTAADVRSILGTVSSEMVFRCAHAVVAEDATAALGIVAQLVDEGKDLRDFLRGLVAHFRNLLLVGASGGAVIPDGSTAEEARVLKEQAASFSPAVCIRAIETLSDAEKEMRRDSQHRLLLEIAILRLVSRVAPTPATVAAPIEALSETRTAPAAPAHRPVEARREAPAPAPRPAPPAPSAPSAPARPEAQAPAQEAAPAVPPTRSRPLDMDEFTTHWPLIVERAGSVSLRGILRDVRPADLTTREVVLLVRQGYTFHRDQLDRPDNQKAIREAIRTVAGVDLAVRVRMENEEAAAPAPEPKAEAAPPRAAEPVAPARPPEAAPAPPAAQAQDPAPAQPSEEPNPYDPNTVSVKDVLDMFQGQVIQSKDER